MGIIDNMPMFQFITYEGISEYRHFPDSQTAFEYALNKKGVKYVYEVTKEGAPVKHLTVNGWEKLT